MAGRSGDTARLLVVIGLVLQLVTVLILFGAGAAILGAGPAGGVIGGLLLALAFIGVIWLILVYYLSYLRIAEGRYEEARTPTLVFGILSLISLGVVSGILYIIGYVKLDDAIAEEGAAPTVPWADRAPAQAEWSNAPSDTAPRPFGTPTPSAPLTSVGSAFCPNCGRPTPGNPHFCRACGASLH